MTKQKQTNNKVVKIYKDKRNSLSFLLNNEMLSQPLMLLLSELKNFGPWKRIEDGLRFVLTYYISNSCNETQ